MEPILSKYLHSKGKKLALPIAGTFELTPHCNFSCKMCYVHLSAEEQKCRGQELTADDWIQLAQEAKKAGMIFLLLTGGEPTLRSDFPRIYRALHEMGFILSINSNGYLLCGEILELLRQLPPMRLNISLYGTSNETYEELCGIPAYDRILTNIHSLRDAGICVKINMSVTPENGAQMHKVYAQAKELGAKVQVTPYMFPPIRIHPEMFGQNHRMCAEVAGRLMAEYARISLSETDFQLRVEAATKGLRVESNDEDCEGMPDVQMRCRAGTSSFWMTWDGKMLPCGQMVEPAFDVKTLGFAQCWHKLRQATQEIRLPSECIACQYRHVCHVCAAMCYCETGRFNGKPEYVCRMSKAYACSLAAWNGENDGD